jgi:hypothetical protein
MMKSLALVVLAACVPAVASAQNTRSYPCTNGGLTRRVEVAYLGTADVPCEVRYHKEGEDPVVLWRATVDSGYCEAQAQDFILKLQGLGWTCSDAGSAPAASAPPPAREDDTAALAADR